jgi:hypothetical protein
MKKTFALLAFAALAVACAKKDIDPNDVRAAMPQAAVVKIGTPSDTDPNALSVAPTVGTVSEYAVASWWTAATFNFATAWTLTVVQFITAFPPTACDPDHCTWGPWNDAQTAATWKLDVTQNGDGYDYVLAGHPSGSATFVSVISGTAFKGSQAGRGNGNLTLNFDNGRVVNPSSNDHGVLDVTYDNRTNLQIDALFMGARNDDPENPASQYINIAYKFGALATGGELQVMFETTDGVKNLSLRTRWAHDAPGRGDARYTEGSTAFEASQCWPGTGIGAWTTVYERVTDGVTVVTTGPVSGCGSFSDPLYSDLVLPQ